MVLADSLMVVALFLGVIAAGFLTFDAIWAQGARFQRDKAESRKDSIESLILAETTSVNSLPKQYTDREKEEMIRKFEAEFASSLEDAKKTLNFWEKHPVRVQRYALMGLAFIVIASILQGVAYFVAR